MTCPRVRGLFVFAASRGDLRPEPGLGHCFFGPAALPLPASAVLGCRPFPQCSGLSDGGECGESGGVYQGASSSPSSSWRLCWRGWKPKGYGGGWQPRSPWVTGLRTEQAWEHEDLHLDVEQRTVLPSFLLDLRISDQIFSSLTLLSVDSCPASPGYDKLGSLLKTLTNSMVGASPM